VKRICENCGEIYDDVNHSTICPHEYFEMCCIVGNGEKIVGIARSLEELHQMLEGNK